VCIWTPDKDLAQCVVGERVVLVDRLRKCTYDEAAVCAKFGVPPSAIPDYLALVGDTADGIPGIVGWGAKSAAAVLQAYGGLESIPNDGDLWTVKLRGAKRLAENLAARREEVRLYRKLATLRTDVPLAIGVDDLEWRGPDSDLLAELGRELDDAEIVNLAESVYNTIRT